MTPALTDKSYTGRRPIERPAQRLGAAAHAAQKDPIGRPLPVKLVPILAAMTALIPAQEPPQQPSAPCISDSQLRRSADIG